MSKTGKTASKTKAKAATKPKAAASKRTTKKAGGSSKAKPRKTATRGAGRSGNATSLPGPKPRVAIIGGGIAGLQAALKLQENDFDVTLFERNKMLGGNTSSEEIDDVEYDVYPHMFCEWYTNFWALCDDVLGENSREKFFSPRAGTKMREATKPEDTDQNKYIELLNPTSMEAVVENLKSGAMSPAEIFLLGYSGIDLAAHPFDRDSQNTIQMLDVNGFIYSRGYATENVAAMQNYILMLIWSIQSSWTAAATYQNFLRHNYTFPDRAPFSWLLKGSMSEKLIKPIRQRLEDDGCTIRCDTEIVTVRLLDDRPILRSRKTPHSEGEYEANEIIQEDYDYVILAVGIDALRRLVMTRDDSLDGVRIVEKEPELANLRRLSSVAIPVVDLHLTKKLDGFPNEHIGLAGSKYGLTVIDIQQLWDNNNFNDKTVLVIAASDGVAIPAEDPKMMGVRMIEEFANYYPEFEGILKWGDKPELIDWDKSHVRTNTSFTLFRNDTGSWAWRPQTLYPDHLPRVFFAGDLVRTDVDMATVEGAIQSGLRAAHSVQAQDAVLNNHPRRGGPIVEQPHEVYSTTSFRAAKLFYLPFAYMALAKVAFEQFEERRRNDRPVGANEFTLAEYMAIVPLQYTIDWWKGAYWLIRSLLDSGEDDPLGGRVLYLKQLAQIKGAAPQGAAAPDPHHPANPAHGDTKISDSDAGHTDEVIGLPEATLMVAGEVISYLIDQLAGNNNDQPIGWQPGDSPGGGQHPGHARAAPAPPHRGHADAPRAAHADAPRSASPPKGPKDELADAAFGVGKAVFAGLKGVARAAVTGSIRGTTRRRWRVKR
ncbi:FAD-dependent oxidoreductase [Erythrobacter sp. HKB08]|uniref:FAD-dependent oxidoreductase n=1 Tax=Erythrobacter sp. HKB08 TaxID=2502843 RepID=UPI0010091D5E|nr:FAD-dependent oxidoreductase [Erythrobacter sp. HKB08]